MILVVHLFRPWDCSSGSGFIFLQNQYGDRSQAPKFRKPQKQSHLVHLYRSTRRADINTAGDVFGDNVAFALTPLRIRIDKL